MERNDVINIVPKPTNQDVIIYDFSLKDLIDVDVLEKYNFDFAAYKIKKENYLLLDKEIKEYEESLNKIYLYTKTWSEIDYIEMLKKEKQNYSILYNDVKKIENNINILEKKYKTINEQIEIQRKKDIKEIEEKKQNIDEEISEVRNNIFNLKNKVNELVLQYNRIKIELSDVNDEIKLLNSMQKELSEENSKKEYKCQYCGSIITNGHTKRHISSLLNKTLEKKNKILNSLTESLSNTEKNLFFYKEELTKQKAILKNDIEFKKQDYNFYIKKSIKILELEATRDEVIKKILQLKKEYNNNSKTKKQDFIDIKDRIAKYELSLENLKKIKENKKTFKEKYKNLNILKGELISLNSNLKLYKKFLEIYYKIYQQKINDYFGLDIKFKLFKFNDFELQEIFEVYYKDVEYSQLSKANKDKFDKIYREKIFYFS